MTAQLSFPDRLQEAFKSSQNGVVGVVEGLLELCPDQGIRLAWNANECQARLLSAEVNDSTSVPIPKSVFRAILARLAALCNERSPNSVSPYGGEGELSLGKHPPTIYRVTFANTSSEQSLEVQRKIDDTSGSKEFTILLEGNGASHDLHVVKVRGYRLQRVALKGEGESSWLGILAAPGESDVYTALFPGSRVVAAFCGEVHFGESHPAQ